jgi:hypothetical protein
MTRRPPKGGVGEPLFGEEWWASDQRLFQDSVTPGGGQHGAAAAPSPDYASQAGIGGRPRRCRIAGCELG